jgi:hypothetical protein
MPPWKKSSFDAENDYWENYPTRCEEGTQAGTFAENGTLHPGVQRDIDEAKQKYLAENPGIENISIPHRRNWERYLRRKAQMADYQDLKAPMKLCGYCSYNNPAIELECKHCRTPFERKVEPAIDYVDKLRQSHAIRLGLERVDSWRFALRGRNKGNRESGRAADAYKQARQMGFKICVYRFMNDPWYRETCVQNGLTMKDMFRYEIDGDPANRTELYKPMTKAEREDAGFGKWLPDVQYRDDQGGNDTNYRGRVPKGKGRNKGHKGKGKNAGRDFSGKGHRSYEESSASSSAAAWEQDGRTWRDHSHRRGDRW